LLNKAFIGLATLQTIKEKVNPHLDEMSCSF
jgi:hypothetical protein